MTKKSLKLGPQRLKKLAEANALPSIGKVKVNLEPLTKLFGEQNFSSEDINPVEQNSSIKEMKERNERNKI